MIKLKYLLIIHEHKLIVTNKLILDAYIFK